MREYMRNPPQEIDDDFDISIEIHSPSKGEPGYRVTVANEKPEVTKNGEHKDDAAI